MQKLILSRNAAKLIDPGRGYKMVCKAPDWKVIYYSDSRKKIASSPFAKFDGGLARRLAVVMATFSGCDNPSTVKGWVKSGFKNYRGQLCQSWIIRKDIAAKRDMQLWEMLNSNEIKVAPQICALVSSQVCLPNHGSICLFYQNGSSVARTVLETNKMRKTLVPSTVFDVPKGYEISTPEKVMFTNQDFDM